MDNRTFLEQKIPHFNGNKYVIGVLNDGTKIRLVYEGPLVNEFEMADVDTGMVFHRNDFSSFENTGAHAEFLHTKNHNARNHFRYITSGKNYKQDTGNLKHLIN
ncbi:MAG: hypothetical protein H7A24_02310 [Leptospiraceae bacterium]|nr:hypothetical protein [Leptospiraceae bacterium]MCP5510683.1 hypothetical protein [Leptospiraceae bacterium]